MLTPRERFLNQFNSTILVHGIQRWSLRLKAPPVHVPGSLYDAMTTCNGRFSVTRSEFYAAIWPMIIEIHEKGRKRQERRPDVSLFADRLYDVLTATGIEVTIGLPVEAHGHRIGAGRSV
jgi:hypothetical protein